MKPSNNFVAFIPKKLIINERPELACFPLNILIARHAVQEGNLTMGSVLYVPNLTSLEVEGSKSSLNYISKYCPDYWLKITFDTELNKYEAEKYHRLERLALANGTNWQGFFQQVALLGLVNGERCQFDRVGQ